MQTGAERPLTLAIVPNLTRKLSGTGDDLQAPGPPISRDQRRTVYRVSVWRFRADG